MSIFGLLFLILLGYFVVWPLVRILYRINKARRQFREMTGAAGQRGFGNGFYGSSPFDVTEERKEGWTRAPRRRKKIEADTGEYIAFEEVTVERTTTFADGSYRKEYTVEQQIIDAEWEDLK